MVKAGFGSGIVLASALGQDLTDSTRAADASQLVAGKDKRLIVLKEDPAVFETPLSLINQSQITPSELLFVRNNQQPKAMATLAPVDQDDWSLQVQDKSITVRQLKDLPQSSVEMVLQCSGNGRSLFSNAAQTAGTQWGKGGMGCVKLGGVPVRDVLKNLNLEPENKHQYVLAEGKDKALPDKEDFLHTLPIDEVINRSFIALTLNDKPLPAIHGGPIRLVTPGVFATMHIKWLGSLEFVAAESSNYNHIPRYRVPKSPIKPGTDYKFSFENSTFNWKMKVKTVILSHGPNATVAAGKTKVEGIAFNDGAATIETVLVSSNQGQTWKRAKLDPPDSRYAWTRFSAVLNLARGKQEVWTRAVDQLGRSQPLDGSIAWNPRGYEWNGVEKISLNVT